jgi:hypothetical protein
MGDGWKIALAVAVTLLLIGVAAYMTRSQADDDDEYVDDDDVLP